MIVRKKENKINETEDIDAIECIYDISNILMSTYLPKKQVLYISFNRGDVYSYSNVDLETYNKFETSESQGKFLGSVFRKNYEVYNRTIDQRRLY